MIVVFEVALGTVAIIVITLVLVRAMHRTAQRNTVDKDDEPRDK